MRFEINPENSKTYILQKEQEQLGTLLYDGTFSQENAIIRLVKENNSKIEKKSFWGNEFVVKNGEIPIFHVKQNWNGNMDITNLQQEPNAKYTLKNKSFWKDIQVLVDENQKEILEIGSTYHWKAWNYSYWFQTNPTFQNLSNKELLLFTLMHGIRKVKATMVIFIMFIIIFSANH